MWTITAHAGQVLDVGDVLSALIDTCEAVMPGSLTAGQYWTYLTDLCAMLGTSVSADCTVVIRDPNVVILIGRV